MRDKVSGRAGAKSRVPQRVPRARTSFTRSSARAKLPAEIEVYAGTKHGWCPPDSRVYNDAQAERAWSRQLVLFKETLA